MQTLSILTTATPRPELHNISVIPAVKKLSSVFNINWYINIDTPSMFTKEDKNSTISSFLNSGIENIKIYSDHQTTHFGAAAKRLYTNCPSTDNLYLWLEDDWDLRDTPQFWEALNSDYDFMLCSIAWYVTGNPVFFKQDFFNLLKTLHTTNNNIDPELMMFNAIQIKYNTTNPRVTPPNSIHIPVFHDMGRHWRVSRNIQKLDKYQTHLSETTWK